MAKQREPIAVIISDIHFSLGTLKLASSALRLALDKAEFLNVPLILSGDTNDTKAVIRAEVANSLISILKSAKVPVFILRGNHDQLSEKAEEHGLGYLRPYAQIIDRIQRCPEVGSGVTFFPYHTSTEAFRTSLEAVAPGALIIMHQGVMGAAMGDYVVDKTSIDLEALAPFRCFSGHYHRHQSLGTVTYVGNPYSLSFGEANDGPKGYLILHSDRTFEQVHTRLRRHVLVERTVDDLLDPIPGLNPDDLLWLKVTGPYTALEKLKKKDLADQVVGHANFRFDRIYTEAAQAVQYAPTLSNSDIMDSLISKTSESETQKAYLKNLWREVLSNEAR